MSIQSHTKNAIFYLTRSNTPQPKCKATTKHNKAKKAKATAPIPAAPIINPKAKKSKTRSPERTVLDE